MRRQKAQEEAMQTMQNPQANEETAYKDLLKVLSHLATIVTENRTASDVLEAPKFSDRTEDWNTWFLEIGNRTKKRAWLY
jgi:hypothetical protein